MTLDYFNASTQNVVLHRTDAKGELTPYALLKPGQVVGIPEDLIRETYNFDKFITLGMLRPLPASPIETRAQETAVEVHDNIGQYGGRKLEL